MADLATVAALLMCLAGWALCALTQRDHWWAAGGPLPQPSRRRLRGVCAVAALLLAGALLACIGGHGAGFGILLWMMLMAAGAISVAFTLAWRPRWLHRMAVLMCDTV